MNLIPVSSSQIKAIGFDAATRKMHVVFKSGDTYEYDDVDQSKYEALLDADSVGGMFHQTIKGKHPHKKI